MLSGSSRSGVETDQQTAGSGDLEIPEDALEKFQAAFKIKNLTALNALAKELEGDPATAAAGAEMAKLAKSFDFAGLAELEKKMSGNE